MAKMEQKQGIKAAESHDGDIKQIKTAREFYRAMWNPLYENTTHKQFNYYEMIEFAEEYKDHVNKGR